jgi:transketolase
MSGALPSRPTASEFALAIRRTVLELSRRANVGHIGSCLSVADILAAFYGGVLRIEDPDAEERDRFLLSKGHAALALYAALHLRGWVTEEQLDSFGRNGTALGVHPEHVVPGIDFCSGSLGHGLSVGAGSALAARMQSSGRRVFVLMSDAELNEGSTWEAVMFAAHQRISNLVAIVDWNRQQALGYTKDVLDVDQPAERWKAFGWDVVEVDGHDIEEMVRCARSLDFSPGGRPHALIARTTFGKGVSFMESQIKWHYWPMSETEFSQAMTEVGVRP